MAKKSGQSGHSRILGGLFKTIGWLVLLGVALGVIYHVMPAQQRQFVDKFADQHVSQVDPQMKTPANFTQAAQDLRDNKTVPISNVSIDVDGNVSGDINEKHVQTRLASVGMIGQQSAFYRANASKINDLLDRTLSPNNHAKYSVQETKQHTLYLFIDHQMLQQTWLERGLAYVNVPQGYDSQSTTLYTAQNNAQSNNTNIWQVNGAMQSNKKGYYLDQRAERDYLNDKNVTFDAKGQSTNFWGKFMKFLR